MKKYIKITNYFPDKTLVSRVSLEKLGLSTKRDNPDTIGRFGSGIKFAPIACLRNGWDWVFVGEDSRGEYQMSYAVIQEDGVDCVWHDYGDEMKPSSFTIGAGELSWTDPFQIIREPIANAMDGAKDSGGSWDIEVVDSIAPFEPCTFSVYLSASTELMNIVDKFDSYFLTNRKPLYSYGSSHIYDSYDSSLRVYCQDVLVYHKPDVKSLYDYRFDRIQLNEERTIQSEYDLGWAVATTVASATESLTQNYLESMLKCEDGSEMFEFSSNVASHYSANLFSGNWEDVFTRKYGEDSVIVKFDNSTDSVVQSLKLRGKKGVVVKSELAYKVLASSGIDSYINALGEQFDYDIDYEIESYQVLNTALSIARLAEPGLNSEDITFGVLNDDTESVKGMTFRNYNGNSVIAVSLSHLADSSVQDIIATLIHEFDHFSTDIGDGYSSEGKLFRNVADRRIGKLIFENYKPNPFFLDSGVLCLRVEDTTTISGGLVANCEYSNIMSGLIIKIGNFILTAYGDGLGDQDVFTHMPVFSEDASVILYPSIFHIKEIRLG
jgi:hypothetical protein